MRSPRGPRRRGYGLGERARCASLPPRGSKPLTAPGPPERGRYSWGPYISVTPTLPVRLNAGLGAGDGGPEGAELPPTLEEVPQDRRDARPRDPDLPRRIPLPERDGTVLQGRLVHGRAGRRPDLVRP